MLHRPISRLAIAVAAAGTVCVLGAASAGAVATPAGSWSGPKGPVPNAHTNTAPALTQVFLTPSKHGTLVAWKGQFDNKIRYNVQVSGHWKGTRVVPGAITGGNPAVGAYRDPSGHFAVLLVWKQLGGSKLFYSQGETHGSGAISWTKPVHLAGDISSSGPALIFPAHAPFDRVIVAWKGPFNHVRYSVGTPVKRHFSWTKSDWIGSAANTRTGGAPALAEVSTGPAAGKVYAVFKGYKSGQVRYATTGDPLHFNSSHQLTWSSVSVVPGASTGAAPAASALGSHDSGPIIIAYKSVHALTVHFQTLTAGVWSSSALVPGAETATGPALLDGLLATASANSSGSIFFHIFS
jgi:hypothetical protein